MDSLFNQFYSINNGRSVEAEDPTNKFQCMDLAFAWCDFLKIPRETIRHLYAYQVWTQASTVTKQYFDLIPNGPDNVPSIGDLVVFGTQVGYAGHISIEKNSNSTNLNSFDQNWAGKQYATSVTHFNYYGVLGWLHPKNVSQPLTDAQKVSKIHDIAFGSSNDSVARTQIKQVLG